MCKALRSHDFHTHSKKKKESKQTENQQLLDVLMNSGYWANCHTGIGESDEYRGSVYWEQKPMLEPSRKT